MSDILVKPTAILEDQGTVVLFQGEIHGKWVDIKDKPTTVRFAVDAEHAQVLVDAILEDQGTLAHVEPWQIL